ncbi:hypothetical protein J5X86_01210 [Streptomyces sp. NEAU-YJ-81]|nr:hypothetical protein [Streptomyces sp. NEAU-YJ-81]
MSLARLAARTHTSAATAQRRLHRLRLTGGAEIATVVGRCQVGLESRRCSSSRPTPPPCTRPSNSSRPAPRSTSPLP